MAARLGLLVPTLRGALSSAPDVPQATARRVEETPDREHQRLVDRRYPRQQTPKEADERRDKSGARDSLQQQPALAHRAEGYTARTGPALMVHLGD